MANSADAELVDSLRRRGGFVALGVAILTGGVLAIAGRGKAELVASVLFATLGVAPFAFFAGRKAGAVIATRGWPAALGIGALGGLASLLAAAVMASFSGLLWSAYDGRNDPYLFSDYVVKPFIAVLGYGFIIAILLGAVSGAVIRGGVAKSS